MRIIKPLQGSNSMSLTNKQKADAELAFNIANQMKELQNNDLDTVDMSDRQWKLCFETAKKTIAAVDELNSDEMHILQTTINDFEEKAPKTIHVNNEEEFADAMEQNISTITMNHPLNLTKVAQIQERRKNESA